MSTKRLIRSTTVLSVRRNGSVVLAGDGQVTLGESVIKHSAKKIRRLYNDKIVAGFAGSTADAFTLFSRFEAKLEQYHGNLGRSAVELAKDWRTDKYLRHLEALREALLSGDADSRSRAVIAALEQAKIAELPRTPDGRHIAADLMAFYFRSSDANDLCYRAAIGRDLCRGLDGSEQAPAPLKGRV